MPTGTRRHAVLTLDSSNRLYANQAADLLAGELLAVRPAMHASIDEVAAVELGGVRYVVFVTPELDDHDRFIVSNLSSARALFELLDGESRGDLLRPIALDPLAYFSSDLVTIQRYPGKTNEQFTHLVLNLAVAASSAAAERSAAGQPVRVLDPVAGRGTTLNRALTYGYNVSGVEIAAADVDQYRTFITTYLKSKRVKHKLSEQKVRKGPHAGTSRIAIRIGGGQQLELVRGDTIATAEFFTAKSFDVVVADLPYGVQHRAAASGTKARSPHELLDESLDGWRQVMRSGASIALAFNTRTLARPDVDALLTTHGFELVEHSQSFEHIVDRSITRDVTMACKPGPKRASTGHTGAKVEGTSSDHTTPRLSERR